MVYNTQNCWVFGHRLSFRIHGAAGGLLENLILSGRRRILIECSGFTPQMSLAVGTTCLHKFSMFFYALVLMHFVLLARFVA
jgi:hypothetical protein